MRKLPKISSGFTLLELLIAIAIMGILTALIVGNLTSSQKKARDAQRKSDLKELQQALEMYLTDKGSYPTSNSGQIVGCGNCSGDPTACNWDQQSAFRDTTPTNCGSIYMGKMPKDPIATQHYYYWVNTDQLSYKIYTALENTRDSKIIVPNESVSCGTSCNYGVSSTNTNP